MTTVRNVSGCVSQTARENITYTATLTPRRTCGWRGDGDAKQWCNGSLSLMARLQEPRRFQQVMMYT
ncbi:hypothetical protein OK016_19435 [Vibrio chagasii]|nr:hypothetical protein [Vibrio chagasii]